jgi:uncharacterized protein (DUF4415 family)
MCKHHELSQATSSDWETVCADCGEVMTEQPKTGRPAPLGRKVPVGIRLTPDVLEFCKQHPDGFTVLEDAVRKSKAFRDWKKSQK